MNLAHYFIDRPIFAGVLSILIVLVGALSYTQLPVVLFPDVVPPTVVVRAIYPGATAQVVADTVATPIEQEINGVEDMLYMSSISTNDGQTKITVTFKLGTDLDIAQVLTQNRVAIAQARLPEEARRLGVTTQKESPDLLMVAFLYSEDAAYDQLYVSNYAILQMRDVLARIEGVGDVQILGAREYSMRIWLDPERIQALGLTGLDVVEALRTQNVQVAAGQLAQPPVPTGQDFQVVVNTQGRFVDAEQFGNVIVKSGVTPEEGRVVRVKDIARVELGGRDYNTNSFYNGRTAVAMILSQRPGSNALATAEAIQATLETLRAHFPAGLKCEIGYNPTEFVEESIDAVQETVFEAVLLVVLVVIAFLQDWRSALIPLAAIPVSLIGTFAVLGALGFSLNSLSLFGLVLAIGIVVDDAIVVVENVERHLALGESPREATRNAMSEVSGPVIAIALVLCAVFVPTAFISGISGQFYRQFAITIAVATVISAFNSLTLSPALCALMLRPHGAQKDRFARLWDRALGWFFRLFNRAFAFSSEAYAGGVRGAIRFAVIVLFGYGVLLLLTGTMFGVVPTGFIPQTDQAYIITAIQLPDGASLERTDAVVQRAGRILLDTPGVQGAAAFSGFSGANRTSSTNAGVIFSALEPFEERVKSGDSLPHILAESQKRLAEIKEAQIIVLPPPAVRGIGTLGGFAFEVQDTVGQGSGALQAAAGELIAAANQDADLSRVFTFFRSSSPQLYADIDRTKAEMLGVESADVLSTLQVYMGSVYINDFNILGRTFRVTAQADSPFRLEPEDIAMLRTRSKSGAMVPLGSLTTFRSVSGPEYVTRYNLRPAAELNGNTAPGASTGAAIAAMERLAREKLPRGYSFEWTGLYFQEILAGNTAIYIFPLCVLFAFLTLAALYESWSLPLVIILIVPMCLLAAIVGVWLRGMDNNVLTQIGFVVLVGLACKNAILIVEFAKEREDEGMGRVEAAIEASRLRLRPILMTSFAFIFGVVPLITASGAGAEMRQALGTAVFFGMIGVTLFGLLLTPVFYVSVGWLAAQLRSPKAVSIKGGGSVTTIKTVAMLIVLGCTWSAAADPAEYPDMPATAPIGVRIAKYMDVPESAKGPAVDPAKGYRLQDLGGGLYVLTDNAYQSMFLVYETGVVVVDTPPSYAAHIRKAIAEVSDKPITHLIYSHSHIDHIGGTRTLGGQPIIIAQEETKALLARAKDPERPLPTIAFRDRHTLKVGSKVLELSYHGNAHEPGNIFVYAPAQRTLMVVDVIFPGWMPWRRFAVAWDVEGYFAQVEEIKRFDFDTLVAGHVARTGTKADVELQSEFMNDLKASAAQALKTTKPGEGMNPSDLGNPWAVYDDYIDRVAIQCVNALTPRWSKRLAAFDVFVWDQCYAMEQSLRLN